MKRRVLALVMLFLFIGLVGCAKTKVTDVFRFEVRELEMTFYADEAKNLEKELGLIRGAIDSDAEIVYTMSYIDGADAGESCFINDVLEIIEVSPYVNDEGIIEGTIISGENENVKVRAKGEGTVRLTAFLKDSPNVTDSIIVTVTKETLSGLKINVPNNTKYLYVGQTLQLSVDTFPSHIDTEYTFKSSNKLLATVDKNGVVKGISPTTGSTPDVTITVTSTYDPTLSASYKFIVLYESATDVEVSANDQVIEGPVKLTKGDTLQLSAKVNSKEGFAQQKVSYKSSDTKVATVSTAGLITAVEGGKAKITVTSSDNNANFEFEVEVGYDASTALDVKFEGNEIGNDPITVVIDKVYSFTTQVTPVASGNQNVKIEVVNPDDAELVKIDGLKITPLKVGTFTLKISTLDEENPIIKEVSFKSEHDVATSVEITSKPQNLIIGDEYQVVAKVTPSGAKQEINYTSSDATVATVDENGKVVALKNGTVTITAVCKENAEIKATIELKVYDKVTSFEISGVTDNQKLILDNTYEIKITLTPASSMPKSIKVETNDELIKATVDANELVVVLEAWELTTENTIVKIIIDETLEKVLNLTVVETEGE